MKRISLSNRNGSWFNIENADCYREITYFDGNNFISQVTNSQWEHEFIFITQGGKYILNSWSAWQGSIDRYEEISREVAAKWFAKQDFTVEEIPTELIPLVKTYEIL
jgi:hypothetical protein